MASANLRTYETICITKVDMPEDKFTALMERCKAAVATEGKGDFLYSDDWGRAKIAFTIGKDNRGRWTYLRYKSTPEGLNEIQRALRINEFVLRFLTSRADEEGKDFDSIRANMPQDLQDRERARDWREERNARRGGYGGGGGGYGGGRRDYPRDDYDAERGPAGGNAIAGSVLDDADGDEPEGNPAPAN